MCVYMDHGHHSRRHDPYGVETGGGSDRLLQWSTQETRDLLIVRAELDPAFMDTKRNKLLWEMLSTRMKDMGYTRSPDQCKCKWKNLVTRYKGCETMDTERMRQQFPYYNEMQTIFAARMQRMMWLESEGAAAAGSSQKAADQLSSDDDEENNINNLNEIEKGAGRKKRKTKATTQSAATGGSGSSNNSLFNAGEFREMMEGYMRQQMEMEMQWMKDYEERENRRRAREVEWKQRMESLENERISMERRWKEKEQERRIREDERAEKREALVAALLNKLRRDDM